MFFYEALVNLFKFHFIVVSKRAKRRRSGEIINVGPSKIALLQRLNWQQIKVSPFTGRVWSLE